MRGLFVTGTDTGVGKTVVSAALLRAFPTTRYVKPVQTGWPADDDAETVRRLAVVDEGRAPEVGVRLRAPCSPHHAAHLEGARLNAGALAEVVRGADDGRALVVEGAGGLQVPLSSRETLADLARLLALPVLLVVPVRLGSINATLLTLEALRARGLVTLGLALVGPDDPSLTSALDAFAPDVPRVALARLEPLDAATLERAAAGLRAVPWLRGLLTSQATSTHAPPGDLLSRDAARVWHPFTQHARGESPLPVVGATGPWLLLEDGRRLLDGISSWWTNLHGHGHPRIVRALERQARRLDHVQFAGCTHAPAVEVAERLVALAPPGLTRVFFSDDGSTAVEVALKMALQAQVQRGTPRRTRYVAFERAYHGDTVGALSVGDPGVFASPFAALTFPVARAPVPASDARAPGVSEADDVARCLEALRALLARHADDLAAVIVEPMVQAAGGMVFHPRAFLEGVARLTREHGALLVADEVMTGLCRTGPCFAVEHAGVRPDLLCVAKGLSGGMLPLAATLAGEDVFAAFLDPALSRAFLHGHSYTANPIACAAAAVSLDLLVEPATQARIAALGAVHADRLPDVARLPGVREVRHLGTLGVVELRADGSYFGEGARRLARALVDRNLLLRPLGPVLYLLPPYATSSAELHAAYDALAAVLGEGTAG